MEGATLILLYFSLHFHTVYTAQLDTISGSQYLKDGDTLVSSAGTFELGFFRPGSSENTYLGIWYKKISVKTVVWVANRDYPLNGSSASVLKIADQGALVLENNISNILWSTNTTSSGGFVIAELLDTGNLLVTDGRQGKILWQSFDFPTDTLLPGMKFGRDLTTLKEWYLTSWKSGQDPSAGEYSWRIIGRYPQYLLLQGAKIKYRAGPWNGLRFSGAAEIGPNRIYTYKMIINETEEVYSYDLINISVVTRLTLTSSGTIQRYVWVEESKKWQDIFTIPKDYCDPYSICGANGVCSIDNSQACMCLDKTRFVARNEKDWEMANWSGGCIRRRPLDCKNRTDGFIKYSNVKLPDTQNSWFNMSMGMSLKECEVKCLENCTCMAYANTDIRDGGSGCLLWFNDLIDMRIYTAGKGGQDIYVRMASSELGRRKDRASIKIILPVIILGIIIIGFSFTWFWYTWRRKNNSKPPHQGNKISQHFHVPGSEEEAMELPSFSFSTIVDATASFSPDNKLGEGGFGPVYKGMLEEGQQIAVKRLSKTSNQGLNEFKNEVICVSKLQHRNLVKLLGCCIHEDERLLIYEYMPNRSLDFFIFDTTQCAPIYWAKRFSIIKGIARGLLYLHEDSRLRIIHRDLKASNILLDENMMPKISDFGIARSFGGNETQANTDRVVGTYGYMSPEYALDGCFSTKSDVFSFGVLVLEIVSGKRNRGFIDTEHANNLIGHAWRMHNEGRPMELIDATLGESYNQSEVVRSITVGLLCVQQSPDDRPDMSSVIMMLGGEGALLQPKQPAFFMEKHLFVADFSSTTNPGCSTNEMTVTEIDGR